MTWEQEVALSYENGVEDGIDKCSPESRCSAPEVAGSAEIKIVDKIRNIVNFPHFC